MDRPNHFEPPADNPWLSRLVFAAIVVAVVLGVGHYFHIL